MKCDVYWIFKKRSKKKFEHLSNIPRFAFPRNMMNQAVEAWLCQLNLRQKRLSYNHKNSLNQIGCAWDQRKLKNRDTTWRGYPQYSRCLMPCFENVCSSVSVLKFPWSGLNSSQITLLLPFLPKRENASSSSGRVLDIRKEFYHASRAKYNNSFGWLGQESR